MVGRKNPKNNDTLAFKWFQNIIKLNGGCSISTFDYQSV
jgi:hypothetical protein